MKSKSLTLAAGTLLTAVFAQANAAQAESVDLVVGVKQRVPVEQLAENAIRYGITYSPEEIRSASAPADEDYADLISGLKEQGFEIVSESKSHLFITIRADKARVESTFKTRMMENRPAVVPVRLGLIDSVVGLNTHKRVPHLLFSRASVKTDGAQPGVLPAAIKSAYGFASLYSTGLSGKGQHLAIATYDGIHTTDVTAYYKKIGLSPGPSIDVVSFNGTAAYNMDSAMETELDAEFSGMIAPGASIHVFASAQNSDAGELAMFTAILDDNRAKVVNYSWGSCEPQLDPTHKTAMDTVFARAVAQGVNIMVASGDSGSSGCQGSSDLAADYPAIHPNVVGVGGTTLVNSGGTFETGWSGSGGGISTLYDLPSYQAGFQSPYLKRSSPDVSFNADPNSGEAAWEYVDEDGSGSATAPSWLVLGGTSIAAPQWSGFMLLVGEARKTKGLPTLGFLNPRLYGLSASQQSSGFHDVTSGNNGAYSCNAGWDAVTGWGSMKAQSLLGYLTQQ